MITKTVKESLGGFQWYFESDKGHTLSVIFHNGSYGRNEGLFETMRSWRKDVQGYLTFGQVQQAINTLERLDKK